MQFLILFPFPSPASIPHRLINTREFSFPSQAQGLPAHTTNAVGIPTAPLGALGQLAVCLAGAGMVCLAQAGDSVFLSRLPTCTIAGIACSA